jgi:hypothetical protein
LSCIKENRVEIYLEGRGFTFMRRKLKNIQLNVSTFLIFFGKKQIFEINFPPSVFLFLINKKKLILRNKDIQKLHNFVIKLQKIKIPLKYKQIGICLRFRYKRLVNFRKKKRN